MKSVCVLLNQGIKYDIRVKKIIWTISAFCKVDLFYVDGDSGDFEIFNENVRLFPFTRELNLQIKIVRHSFFYNEFLLFVKMALATGVQYDFIWSNDLPCLKAATRIKKKTGAKLIYDSHEIYLETINQFFPMQEKGIRKLGFRFFVKIMKTLGYHAEKKYIKKADHVITVSWSIKSYFETRYGLKNIKVLLNCPFTAPHNHAVDLHKELGLKNHEKIVIYQGGLQVGRGLDLLIDSFSYVNDNIVLLIMGWGNLRKSMEAISQINNLQDKIIFKDPVDQSVLLSYTRGADFGVNLLEPINLNTKLALPNKIFEYIHANIPVVATNMIESVNIISKYQIGLLTEPNSKSIASAINLMANMDLTDFKENCRKAALEYNWEKQEQLIIDIINS